MCLQRPGIFKFAAEFEGGAYRSCEKLVIRFGITLLTSVLTKNHTLIPWQTNLLQISFSIFEAAGYEAYGNFVLQQLHPNGTNTLLWQSFDYPSTLIPTMKLGVNHKTGHQWVLVSSLTDLVLNPGAFSLEWEPKGQELVIRRRGKVCWQSGKLRNNRFEYIPEEAQRMLKYTIVSNGDEDSFSFNSTNDKLTPRWSFSRSGRLSCNEGYVKADLCYGYNNTGGCQRWQDLPKCRNPGDLFVKKTLFPDYENVTFEMNPAFGYSDCEASCWSNCSCDGFSALWVNETGCTFYHWNSSKNFVDTSVAGVELYMLENTGNITPHNGTKRWIWLSAVIATTLLIIFLSILCLLKKRKYLGQEKKRKEMVMKMPHSTICDGLSSIEDFGNVFKKGHELNVFDYTLVMMATNGFSSENKLGQGGFGPVYKGILPTGQEVAVKRLSKTSTQGIMEFKNELTLICELQHMNLVQLLGCCIHEEEKILIYEYMPNKSLDFYLFDSSRSKLLDWNKRFNIIEGIAQGLLYLHKYSRLKVVHRDLKASVIP
ncbi:G-type lectin S-receptor-like serine/threonine-protein kinase B120 isoform X3 [Glycine max]|uniref:G-type lectin S-receptor-like serine/threonine-protein kinase B120 isoform X3 n=1 Tax=Glycine max TaxID=3847 RepID=UPI001B35614B|nr:G-type lectin S-receptor-like serine/threonine-protein kinase B120 isoform X3 [Glycine max]